LRGVLLFIPQLAGVLELADETDSKSVALYGRVGSIPTTGMKKTQEKPFKWAFLGFFMPKRGKKGADCIQLYFEHSPRRNGILSDIGFRGLLCYSKTTCKSAHFLIDADCCLA
jgi:hypothetical protein